MNGELSIEQLGSINGGLYSTEARHTSEEYMDSGITAYVEFGGKRYNVEDFKNSAGYEVRFSITGSDGKEMSIPSTLADKAFEYHCRYGKQLDSSSIFKTREDLGL